MTSAEKQYHKTMLNIGFAMLIFETLIQLFRVALPYAKQLTRFVFLDTAARTVIYELFYGCGYMLAFMLPVLFLRLFVRKSHYEYCSMQAEKPLSPYLPLIVFAGIGLITASSYINSLVNEIPNEFMTLRPLGTLRNTDSKLEIYEIILGVIINAVVPAVCEEFLFRGAILSNCLPFGKTSAYLISSLLFAMMHQNFAQMFYAFVAGILLAIIYDKTKNIWNCVILHFVNNFASEMEEDLFSGVRDNAVVYAGKTLFDLGLVLLGVISLFFLFLLLKKKKETASVGFFGRSLPESEGYENKVLSVGQKAKLFCNFPMLLFLGWCVSQSVFTFIRLLQS